MDEGDQWVLAVLARGWGVAELVARKAEHISFSVVLELYSLLSYAFQGFFQLRLDGIGRFQ